MPLAECRFQLCIDLANRAISYLEPTGDAWETNMARYQKAAALMRIGRYRDAANEALRVHLSGVEMGTIRRLESRSMFSCELPLMDFRRIDRKASCDRTY